MKMETCYWDAETQTTKTRPCTPEEIVQIEKDTSEYLAAKNAVPTRIKRKFGRLVLAQRGRLNDVPSAIASMPEPQRIYAQLAWEDEEEWVRTNDFVLGLGSALELTETEIDDLFRAAHVLSLA